MPQVPITGSVRGRQTYVDDGAGNQTVKVKNIAQNMANAINSTAQMGLNARKNASGGYRGGVTSAQEVPAVSGPSVSADTSYNDEILNQIKSLLNEQHSKAVDYYNTVYGQAKAQNRTNWENNRNQINLNAKRTDNFIRSMYGDAVSGTGLSNIARNRANQNNNLADNNKNYVNADASALASLNQNLSNAANTLAQGFYNFVLPTYESRQRFNDSLVNDIKKFMLAQQMRSM